jgi:hypothetical protein
MTPLSCSNCCYNALQYGSVGLNVGYCTEHRIILRQADFTTCGRQWRKDLLFKDAEDEHALHRANFDGKQVVDLQNRPLTNGTSHFVDSHVAQLDSDSTGSIVAEYGQLGTKIESLAQLRRAAGGRAELARLSLSRVYVRRCVNNPDPNQQGQWTSGLHLWWWTKERLREKPALDIADFRMQLDMDLKRQQELAQWSIVMLRLTFLADLGEHVVAHKNPVASSPAIKSVARKLANLTFLADEAAAEASTDLGALMGWVDRVGAPWVSEAMTPTEYSEISREVHARDVQD